nr:MAG TPA: hypothetical protein [Bacteriophage sp.]
MVDLSELFIKKLRRGRNVQMNNEDKDSVRYAKLYCAIVEVLGSSGCKDSVEEALSIVNWVKKEILKDRSRTLLWTAELVKIEYNKSEDLPVTRIVNQITKEILSNELEILRSEVSRLKGELVDEGKR